MQRIRHALVGYIKYRHVYIPRWFIWRGIGWHSSVNKIYPSMLRGCKTSNMIRAWTTKTKLIISHRGYLLPMKEHRGLNSLRIRKVERSPRPFYKTTPQSLLPPGRKWITMYSNACLLWRKWKGQVRDKQTVIVVFNECFSWISQICFQTRGVDYLSIVGHHLICGDLLMLYKKTSQFSHWKTEVVIKRVVERLGCKIELFKVAYCEGTASAVHLGRCRHH